MWKALGADQLLYYTQDIKRELPSLNVIDKWVWEACEGLAIPDEPPLLKQDISIIKELMATLKIKEDAGITLLTMPKGLTLNRVKNGRSLSLFRFIRSDILEKFGDIPVKKTCRVAITNSILEGSLNLSVDAQKELVGRVGCEMPELLSVAALAILTYRSSLPPIRLYNDYPWIYTRCSEEFDVFYVTIGGFKQQGLSINDDLFDDDSNSLGVGAMRKL